VGIEEQERMQELLAINSNLSKEVEKYKGLMRDARSAYHRVKGDLRITTANLKCAGSDRAHLLKLVEDMREQLDEMSEQLESEIALVNVPAAQALEEIWKHVFPSSYGEWEYPAQAMRHINAAFDEAWGEIRNLRGKMLLAEKNIWAAQDKTQQFVAELSDDYAKLKREHRELEEYTKDLERQLDAIEGCQVEKADD
jgi:chromosome segregation ATPase